MRVGILGGTFDPIHIGHLIIAEEARQQLKLDTVLLIPTGQPWLKEGRPISDARHRLAMVDLAIKGNPAFASSAMEIERAGPTYTIDTLRALRAKDPAAELLFIVGADSLADFHRWKEPEAVLGLCTVVAFGRPGYNEASLRSFEQHMGPAARAKIKVLTGPEIGVSGTGIRRRVALGLRVRYLVPEPVRDYIAKHKLYRGEAGR